PPVPRPLVGWQKYSSVPGVRSIEEPEYPPRLQLYGRSPVYILLIYIRAGFYTREDFFWDACAYPLQGFFLLWYPCTSVGAIVRLPIRPSGMLGLTCPT